MLLNMCITEAGGVVGVNPYKYIGSSHLDCV